MTDRRADPATQSASRSAAAVGIGLRAPHYRELLASPPDVGWMEVHSENYFGEGGQPLHFLERFRERWPISLHGVGLGLGSDGALSRTHLSKLARLAARIEPLFVSEHLCWTAVPGRHLNDLLPLPNGRESLARVCERIDATQEALGRRLLVENVSSYLAFESSEMPEWAFVAEVARRTGCALLLDVNNVHVSAVNLGFDPLVYLDAIPPEAVAEIHLAGYDVVGELLVDTHGKPVSAEVWALYRHAIDRFGAVPTLIEWDTALPSPAVLLAEAAKARTIMDAADGLALRAAA